MKLFRTVEKEFQLWEMEEEVDYAAFPQLQAIKDKNMVLRSPEQTFQVGG